MDARSGPTSTNGCSNRPSRNFVGEHACDGKVDIGQFELSGGERGPQGLVVAVGAREFDVDARRAAPTAAAVGQVGGDAVVVVELARP